MKRVFMILLFLAGIGALAYFLWQRREEVEPYAAAPEFTDAESRPQASAVGQ